MAKYINRNGVFIVWTPCFVGVHNRTMQNMHLCVLYVRGRWDNEHCLWNVNLGMISLCLCECALLCVNVICHRVIMSFVTT